jgi:hypothetical protein
VKIDLRILFLGLGKLQQEISYFLFGNNTFLSVGVPDIKSPPGTDVTKQARHGFFFAMILTFSFTSLIDGVQGVARFVIKLKKFLQFTVGNAVPESFLPYLLPNGIFRTGRRSLCLASILHFLLRQVVHFISLLNQKFLRQSIRNCTDVKKEPQTN